MVLAQVATTVLMAVTFQHEAPPLYAIILIEVFVCMFTAGFAYSWGPLGWLVRKLLLPWVMQDTCDRFLRSTGTENVLILSAGSNRDTHH